MTDGSLEGQIPMTEPVTICLVDQRYPYCTGQVAEVSTRDMKVQLDRPLQRGESVYAAVQSMVMLAEVRYCRPERDGYVVGLELVTRLSEEDVCLLMDADAPAGEEAAAIPGGGECSPPALTEGPEEAVQTSAIPEPVEPRKDPGPAAPAKEPLTPRLFEAIEGLRVLLDAMPDRKVFLTLREASAYSGLPQSYLRELSRRGQLTFLETGAGYRIRRADLERL